MRNLSELRTASVAFVMPGMIAMTALSASAAVTIQVTVPDHTELDRSTLQAIIRQADLTIEGFLNLL